MKLYDSNLKNDIDLLLNLHFVPFGWSGVKKYTLQLSAEDITMHTNNLQIFMWEDN